MKLCADINLPAVWEGPCSNAALLSPRYAETKRMLESKTDHGSARNAIGMALRTQSYGEVKARQPHNPKRCIRSSSDSSSHLALCTDIIKHGNQGRERY